MYVFCQFKAHGSKEVAPFRPVFIFPVQKEDHESSRIKNWIFDSWRFVSIRDPDLAIALRRDELFQIAVPTLRKHAEAILALGERPRIRVLVRAVKGSRAPLVLLPGLVLNDEAGQPAGAAEAVLRNGAVLSLAQDQ